MKRCLIAVTAASADYAASVQRADFQPYVIVDTGQSRCYDNQAVIRPPEAGQPFHGQDAQNAGHQPAYRDNGDGTVSDLNTGLMWQQDPGAKKTYDRAVAGATSCRTGGYADWRLPTIKELYSLINFSGIDSGPQRTGASAARPFIDSDMFAFRYGVRTGPGVDARALDGCARRRLPAQRPQAGSCGGRSPGAGTAGRRGSRA